MFSLGLNGQNHTKRGFKLFGSVGLYILMQHWTNVKTK